MVAIDLLQAMSSVLETVAHLDSAQGLLWQLPVDWTILAQQFDQDILGELTNAFNNFVQSGQVWALLGGVVIGYLLRSMTAY